MHPRTAANETTTQTASAAPAPRRPTDVGPLSYRAAMPSERTYGEIPGYPPGATFTNEMSSPSPECTGRTRAYLGRHRRRGVDRGLGRAI